MIWQDLHTNRRMGDDKTKTSHTNGRSSYLKDYDRILFSAPFRKLQNKTQVFPLPEDIFVHNRLTHSLEVAAVGRSLGSIVGEKIGKIHAADFDANSMNFYQNELANVVSAACLSHDIGNPPFGHAGEVAISDFFKNLKTQNLKELETISAHEWEDLCNFEGNANGFRILVKNRRKEDDSYKLTLTTLSSMIKYPTKSTCGNNKKSEFISNKKYGYFVTEKDAFEEVIHHFSLPPLDDKLSIFARHPFVYLTEAADDICYLIIDLEDASNLGLVKFDVCLELLLPFFKKEAGFFTQEIILNKLNSIKSKADKMAYLRAATINLLVEKCADIFINQEVLLLSGKLNRSLMDYLDAEDYSTFVNLKKFSFKEIYSHKQVAEKELTGYNVINDILQELCSIITSPNNAKGNLIKRIIPCEYDFWGDQEKPVYGQLRVILDYVSSLSDFQAVNLGKQLKGS